MTRNSATEPGPASRRGCPEKDTDQDGVMDDVDACPSEAGPKERAGCPVRDRDEDGVENDLDKCPDERGVPENGGCPPKKNELVVLTREKVEIEDRVYFATAKSQILPKSFGLLDQVADVLKNHDEIPNVTVEGHTDSQGTGLEPEAVPSQGRGREDLPHQEGRRRAPPQSGRLGPTDPWSPT